MRPSVVQSPRKSASGSPDGSNSPKFHSNQRQPRSGQKIMANSNKFQSQFKRSPRRDRPGISDVTASVQDVSKHEGYKA